MAERPGRSIGSINTLGKPKNDEAFVLHFLIPTSIKGLVQSLLRVRACACQPHAVLVSDCTICDDLLSFLQVFREWQAEAPGFSRLTLFAPEVPEPGLPGHWFHSTVLYFDVLGKIGRRAVRDRLYLLSIGSNPPESCQAPQPRKPASILKIRVAYELSPKRYTEYINLLTSPELTDFPVLSYPCAVSPFL
jgi:hypothetical protein